MNCSCPFCDSPPVVWRGEGNTTLSLPCPIRFVPAPTTDTSYAWLLGVSARGYTIRCAGFAQGQFGLHTFTCLVEATRLTARMLQRDIIDPNIDVDTCEHLWQVKTDLGIVPIAQLRKSGLFDETEELPPSNTLTLRCSATRKPSSAKRSRSKKDTFNCTTLAYDHRTIRASPDVEPELLMSKDIWSLASVRYIIEHQGRPRIATIHNIFPSRNNNAPCVKCTFIQPTGMLSTVVISVNSLFGYPKCLKQIQMMNNKKQ